MSDFIFYFGVYITLGLWTDYCVAYLFAEKRVSRSSESYYVGIVWPLFWGAVFVSFIKKENQ